MITAVSLVPIGHHTENFIDYIPCVVRYVSATYFITSSLYFLFPSFSLHCFFKINHPSPKTTQGLIHCFLSKQSKLKPLYSDAFRRSSFFFFFLFPQYFLWIPTVLRTPPGGDNRGGLTPAVPTAGVLEMHLCLWGANSASLTISPHALPLQNPSSRGGGFTYNFWI